MPGSDKWNLQALSLGLLTGAGVIALWGEKGICCATRWQKVLVGEPEPSTCLGRNRNAKAQSKDHRNIALDVRELIRKRVFDQPVGSVFRLNLRFSWLRLMRLNSSSLDLELVTGRTVVVPLVWARCGVMGERARLHALSFRRKALQWPLVRGTAHPQHRAKVPDYAKIRRKLGDYGDISNAGLPPKPRGMWRRTYARNCAALADNVRHVQKWHRIFLHGSATSWLALSFRLPRIPHLDSAKMRTFECSAAAPGDRPMAQPAFDLANANNELWLSVDLADPCHAPRCS
jgi:hypothetical protein